MERHQLSEPGGASAHNGNGQESVGGMQHAGGAQGQAVSNVAGRSDPSTGAAPAPPSEPQQTPQTHMSGNASASTGPGAPPTSPRAAGSGAPSAGDAGGATGRGPSGPSEPRMDSDDGSFTQGGPPIIGLGFSGGTPTWMRSPTPDDTAPQGDEGLFGSRIEGRRFVMHEFQDQNGTLGVGFTEISPRPRSDNMFSRLSSFRDTRPGRPMARGTVYFLSFHDERRHSKASERAMQSLRRIPLAQVPASERDCTICYEPLVDYQEGITPADDHSPLSMPSCNHFFGASCLRSWLESAASCPLCRAHIESDFDARIAGSPGSPPGSTPFFFERHSMPRPHHHHHHHHPHAEAGAGAASPEASREQSVDASSDRASAEPAGPGSSDSPMQDPDFPSDFMALVDHLQHEHDQDLPPWLGRIAPSPPLAEIRARQRAEMLRAAEQLMSARGQPRNAVRGPDFRFVFRINGEMQQQQQHPQPQYQQQPMPSSPQGSQQPQQLESDERGRGGAPAMEEPRLAPPFASEPTSRASTLSSASAAAVPSPVDASAAPTPGMLAAQAAATTDSNSRATPESTRPGDISIDGNLFDAFRTHFNDSPEALNLTLSENLNARFPGTSVSIQIPSRSQSHEPPTPAAADADAERRTSQPEEAVSDLPSRSATPAAEDRSGPTRRQAARRHPYTRPS